MSAVDGKKRTARRMSDATREKLSAKAREWHLNRRGFEVPEELKPTAVKAYHRFYNRHGFGPSPEWMKAALGLCLVLFMAMPALSHEAPSGWKYPVTCCGKMDCAPLPANALEPTPNGWRVIATGEVIPYAMARASGDNQNHRCRSIKSDMNSATRQSSDAEGAYYCLFVAPGGL